MPTYEVNNQTSISWPHRKGETFVKDRFVFQRVFDYKAQQDLVYEFTAKSVVENFLKGYNGAIITYGQTTSGKTYTMEGPISTNQTKLKGIIPRSIDEIFTNIEYNKSKDVEINLTISVFEIYAEKIYDLLNSNYSKNIAKSEVKLRFQSQGEATIFGLNEIKVSNNASIIKCLQMANKSRSVGSNATNTASSRGHLIYQINLKRKNNNTNKIKTSKLLMVDLAGSEKSVLEATSNESFNYHKKQEQEKMRLETKNINMSLHNLKRVIETLSENSVSRKAVAHVPFTSSVLTKILRQSLSGNSVTSLILTICPEFENLTESYNTLQFGQKASRIKTFVKKNMNYLNSDLLVMIDKLKRELKLKESRVTELLEYIESKG